VCALDPDLVTYSGSLAELEKKFRNRETLDITAGY
jgi:hypothetical protein